MKNTLNNSAYQNHNYLPNHAQQGIGLIEVMVALMLLAVAVLGFSAMQMTAVKATDESLLRTRALTVMRGGAEMMRANPDGIVAFKTAINGTQTSVNNTDTVDAQGKSAAITKDSCFGSQICTMKQLAVRDALAVKDHATANELDIKLVTCPSATTTTLEVQCFVASWGVTAAAISDTAPTAPKTVNCAKADGTYNTNAQCFIMEAY